MQLPTEAEVTALHQRYAPTDEVLQVVYMHCQIVWAIAEQLIESENLDVDKDLVRVGCLLHDIGVYWLFDDGGTATPDLSRYILHGLLGEEVLKAEGLPESMWRFASHHTGVGLTKADIERQNLPLPHTDFLAETPEEKLVMYADKFHSKDLRTFTKSHLNSFESIRQNLAKYGEDKVTDFEKLAETFGTPDLENLAQTFRQPIE